MDRSGPSKANSSVDFETVVRGINCTYNFAFKLIEDHPLREQNGGDTKMKGWDEVERSVSVVRVSFSRGGSSLDHE